MSREAKLILVAGVDASGKTTLIDRLANGSSGLFKAVEPTSWSSEAREFKIENLTKPIDLELIEKRRSLYLGLHKKFASEVIASLVDGANVVTTASPLVTQVAHDTMAEVIGHTGTLDHHQLVRSWIEDGVNIPDLAIILHAPFDVIRSRIAERIQQKVDSTEIYWGFNAPFYLDQYQASLRRMAEVMEAEGIECRSYDTSAISTAQITQNLASWVAPSVAVG